MSVGKLVLGRNGLSMVSGWRNAVKLRLWTLRDVVSASAHTQLTSLLRRHFPALSDVGPAGHFLLANPPHTDLGADGYADYQAPRDDTNRSLFSRRMWVRGQLTTHVVAPPGAQIECTERIKSVRSVSESVFVEIQRQMVHRGRPVSTELRTLVYTNKVFRRSDQTETQRHRSGMIRATINISPGDVALYLELTQNLHRIHLDPQYAKSEGFENIVVQGPFMVSLATSWMLVNGMDCNVFRYRNLRPCYVGDLEIGIHGNVVEMWGSDGVCFRGEVGVKKESA